MELQVLVWQSKSKKTLSFNDGALEYLHRMNQSQHACIVGVLNSTNDGNAVSEDHHVMLQTMGFKNTAPVSEHTDLEALVLFYAHADSSTLVLCGNSYQDQARLILLLLSSFLLYSHDGELGIEQLQWIENVPNTLKVRANQDEAGVAKELDQHLPKFVWIARNSKVKWLNGANGVKLTPNEYFQSIFALDSGFSATAMKTNSLKTYFTKFFKHRECYMISRAVEGSTKLSLETTKDELRTQYIEQVETIAKQFLSSESTESFVPAKTINKQTVPVAFVSNIVQLIIQDLNTNELPTLQTIAISIMQYLVQEGVQRAITTYKNSIINVSPLLLNETSSDNKLPAAEQVAFVQRDLFIAHVHGLHASAMEFNNVKAKLTEQYQQKYLSPKMIEYQTQIQRIYDSIVQKNTKVSKEVSEYILKTMLPSSLDDIGEDFQPSKPDSEFPEGLPALLVRFKTILQNSFMEYKAKAKGEFVYATLAAYLSHTLFGMITEWGGNIMKQFQSQLEDLQNECNEAANELEIAKAASEASSAFSTEDYKKVFEEQVQSKTEQLAEVKKSLGSELENKKNEIDRLVLEMKTLEMKHTSRVESIEGEIQYTKNKMLQLEQNAIDERIRRATVFESVSNKLLDDEKNYHLEEKNLLSEQKELMSRVVHLEREIVTLKTAHLRTKNELENKQAQEVEKFRLYEVEAIRQLKSQAKNDIMLLKKAYENKKNNVQAQLDEINALCKQCEEQLELMVVRKQPGPPMGNIPSSHNKSTSGSTSSSSTASSAINNFLNTTSGTNTSSGESGMNGNDQPSNQQSGNKKVKKQDDICQQS